jgi:ribonuclease HI
MQNRAAAVAGAAVAAAEEEEEEDTVEVVEIMAGMREMTMEAMGIMAGMEEAKEVHGEVAVVAVIHGEEVVEEIRGEEVVIHGEVVVVTAWAIWERISKILTGVSRVSHTLRRTSTLKIREWPNDQRERWKISVQPMVSILWTGIPYYK